MWSSVIPTARIVDSNVNRCGSTRCDSPSALDGGDGDDRGNHTFGLVDGRSAGGGGRHAGREGGSSDAGDRAVAGGLVAGSCGGGLCDGAPDAARVGAPGQRGWAGGA